MYVSGFLVITSSRSTAREKERIRENAKEKGKVGTIHRKIILLVPEGRCILWKRISCREFDANVRKFVL